MRPSRSVFGHWGLDKAIHKWDLYWRIYIHLREYPHIAFQGENTFVFLCVCHSHRTRLQGDFWLFGFLRNPFCPMDLGISAHHMPFACSCFLFVLQSSLPKPTTVNGRQSPLTEFMIILVFYEITKTNLPLALGTLKAKKQEWCHRKKRFSCF